MPITDDDVTATERSILDPLSAGSLSFAGLSASEVAQAHRQLAMIAKRVEATDTRAMVAAVDALRVTFDRAATDAVVTLATQLEAAATIDSALDETAGAALTHGGFRLWTDKRNAEALPLYERAAQRLSPLDTVRAVDLWGNATSACAILLRESSMDAGIERFEQLRQRTFANEHRTLRYWALYTGRRMSAGLFDKGRFEQALAFAERTLALPIETFSPNSVWYENVILAHGRAAASLRELGRHEEAIAHCRAAADFSPKATTDTAICEIAWCLTEAAFIAADRLAEPERALAFAQELKAMSAHPKAKLFLDECAYAAAMQARALVLLGRSDDALAACDEAIALAQRTPEPKASDAAYAAALDTRGNIFAARGQLELARAAWTESVDRFGDDAREAVREEVSRARNSLKNA